MQPVDDGFEADLVDEAHHEAVMEALGENIDLHAEVKTLRAHIESWKVEEAMWVEREKAYLKERDRYREALERIASKEGYLRGTGFCQNVANKALNPI